MCDGEEKTTQRPQKRKRCNNKIKTMVSFVSLAYNLSEAIKWVSYRKLYGAILRDKIFGKNLERFLESSTFLI